MTDDLRNKPHQSSSDTIRADVGENAQNVIVGKDVNFVQIAGIKLTKWVARLLLFALCMGTISLIVYTINSVMTVLPAPAPRALALITTPRAMATDTVTATVPSELPAICPQPAVHDPLENFDQSTAHVPAQCFTMGDAEAGLLEQRVAVQEFWIDKYEVTNFQYQQFVASGHAPPTSWITATYTPDEAFHPVTGVTWDDAAAYCQWLEKRLPTEAEWEVSCRGGDVRKFPWGNVWQPGHANVVFAGCKGTLPVGSFSPQGDSVWGVTDLLGNVSEWTSSAMKEYPYLPKNAETDDPNDDRVIRGGDFAAADDVARCTVRQSASHLTAVPWVGFRCVQNTKMR